MAASLESAENRPWLRRFSQRSKGAKECLQLLSKPEQVLRLRLLLQRCSCLLPLLKCCRHRSCDWTSHLGWLLPHWR
jgi:hypothetical protein